MKRLSDITTGPAPDQERHPTDVRVRAIADAKPQTVKLLCRDCCGAGCRFCSNGDGYREVARG